MDEENVSTLAGREELPGKVYPMWVENVAFLGAVGGAIILGQWIWLESGWASVYQWAASICGLPLLALFATEAVGRMVQSVHMRQS